jgi:endonuclease-8
VLVGLELERIETPQRRHALDRWPDRLASARVEAIDTHGKHLFLRFDNDLTIHSHLRMSGRWRVFERGWDWGRRAWTAWLVLETATHAVVQFNGPILELVRSTRTRFDPYLRRLGPDILAKRLDLDAILVRLRSDDQTRPIGDALLDQRTVAGIGNLWKNESLHACRIDPWRELAQVDERELAEVILCAREMMSREVHHGGRLAGGEVFEQTG